MTRKTSNQGSLNYRNNNLMKITHGNNSTTLKPVYTKNEKQRNLPGFAAFHFRLRLAFSIHTKLSPSALFQVHLDNFLGFAYQTTKFGQLRF